MAKHNFDTLDIKILQALAANARKPYLEIARECGVSGASVHQRIQRLTANGVIKSTVTVIDPEAIGYETEAIVGIFLRDTSQYDVLLDALKDVPEVVECYFSSGNYDVMIKLQVHNNEHLFQVLRNKIQPLGLAKTETHILFKEVFKRQIPVRQEYL